MQVNRKPYSTMCDDHEPFEQIRNRTVLFFYETLTKSEKPISLHELSCLFGLKKFTVDMRQVVGNSQNGLRKFLLQFPFLFTIDGNFVLLNVKAESRANLTDSRFGSTRARNRLKAIEYFAIKLCKYGLKIQVPLRNLFGYRSQATFEVRRLIGQSFDEFRQFFQQFPEIFILDNKNENVILNAPFFDESFQPLVFLRSDQFAKFAHSITTILVNNRNQLAIQQVFELFSRNESIFINCKQFVFFLKLFPDTFVFRDGFVVLKDSKLNKNDDEKNTAISKIQNGNQENGQQDSLKSRVSSLLMKTLQQNTKTLVETKNMENEKCSYKLICTLKEAKKVVDVLMTSLSKKSSESLDFFSFDKSIVAVDCKGITVGRLKGKVSLIEIKTEGNVTFIFDVLMCSELITILKDILESEDIIKVIFDSKTVAFNLHSQFNVNMKCVFDLQVAHAVFLHDKTDSRPFRKMQGVTMNSLCEMYDVEMNPLRSQMRQNFRQDKFFWIKRPLSDDKIKYLVADLETVSNLFEKMKVFVVPEMLPLLMLLNREQVLTLIEPSDVKLSKKARKIEYEVFDLRDKLKNSNGKIVLSNREIRLLKYIDLTDEEKDKIKTSEKVARKLERIDNDCDDGHEISADEDQNDLSISEDDDEHEDEILDESQDSLTSNEPSSLTESLQLVEMVLKDSSIDKVDKIDKLESLLSFAEHFSKTSVIENKGVKECCCHCHENKPDIELIDAKEFCNKEIQTMSTGDIISTKVFFN